jgi:hypothetical protein
VQLQWLRFTEQHRLSFVPWPVWLFKPQPYPKQQRMLPVRTTKSKPDSKRKDACVVVVQSTVAEARLALTICVSVHLLRHVADAVSRLFRSPLQPHSCWQVCAVLCCS